MGKMDSMCYKLLTVLLSGDYGELIFIVLFSIFLIFYNQYNLLKTRGGKALPNIYEEKK